MKDKILQTLRELRAYALAQGVEADFDYHEEVSSLIRYANSAISLNTSEHLIRLDITAYSGQRRANYQLITNLDQVAQMKRGVDLAGELANQAQPLTYPQTLPHFTEPFEDESGYDPALAEISNAERLAYFSQVVEGLETGDIKSSGIFSCGAKTIAQINTRSEATQYFKTSDAQIEVVLSHARLKWEVRAAQSAQKKTDLDPRALNRELAFLAAHYQQDEPLQLPLGRYAIVFGQAAIATMLDFMNYIGFGGGMMKRGFSFLSEKEIGQKVFSDQFTLVDDPTCLATFPYARDFCGLPRRPFPLFQKGNFQGFTWFQDDADEFGQTPTGHTVDHLSLVMAAGNYPVHTLEDLLSQPRDCDILYIPFLHYTNIVNPSKGLFTGSSRFGALLLRQDGSSAVPYNVRLTLSLLETFGEKVVWLSQAASPTNVSHSYGARNPRAIVLPLFMRVNDLEISHSNASY